MFPNVSTKFYASTAGYYLAFLTISGARKIINPLLATNPAAKDPYAARARVRNITNAAAAAGREETGASVVLGSVAGPSASAVTMATVSLRLAPLPPDFKLLPFLLRVPRAGPGTVTAPAKGGKGGGVYKRAYIYIHINTKGKLPRTVHKHTVCPTSSSYPLIYIGIYTSIRQ